MPDYLVPGSDHLYSGTVFLRRQEGIGGIKKKARRIVMKDLKITGIDVTLCETLSLIHI